MTNKGTTTLVEDLNEQKRKVDFNNYDFSVKELVSMVAEGIINIAPEYQRQFRWDTKRQSTLIESLFLGIPIPNLFMATNANGTWEVIDGVQRITTMIHFLNNKEAKLKSGIDTEHNLELSDLEKLSLFNGKKFDDLPPQIKLDFILKPLKVTTLSDKSDKMVRFDLFERLNTGGIRLTPQEIRSCVYRGKFNDFIKKLAKDDNFLSCIKFDQTQLSDGTTEEAVLRFFAFLNNYKNFKSSVIGFLNEYMQQSSEKFAYTINERIFKKTFSALSKLPQGITSNRKGGRAFRVNFYEGVAVGAALALKEKGAINLENFYTWIEDPIFIDATTGATNTPNRVSTRIKFSKEQFLK